MLEVLWLLLAVMWLTLVFVIIGRVQCECRESSEAPGAVTGKQATCRATRQTFSSVVLTVLLKPWGDVELMAGGAASQRFGLPCRGIGGNGECKNCWSINELWCFLCIF